MGRLRAEETPAHWMSQTTMPEQGSIRPLILDWAKGNSSSEVGCAHLVAARRLPVPLDRAPLGFDIYRKNWFIRAMMGFVDDGEWCDVACAELERVWKTDLGRGK